MPKTAREVFDALIAAAPAHDLEADLRALPPGERATLLCTACVIRHDVEAMCAQSARRIERILRANCPLFQPDSPACARATVLPFMGSWQRP